MFLEAVGSSDERFKGLQFQDGLNILVADRTAESDQGDSRNSVGKTSFVKVVRYLLGGDLPSDFRAMALANHSYVGRFTLPSLHPGLLDEVVVTRGTAPTTRVLVAGWSATAGANNIHVDDWRDLLSKHVFGIPETVGRPTSGQILGQLVRTYFNNPLKGHQSEADWESGVRVGFMLGLSPQVLSRAGDVDRLAKQNKAIRKAVREGALAHLSLDVSGLRTELATARRLRDRLSAELLSFRVDERYAEHQVVADELTEGIQRLNDEGLALQRRQRELRDASEDDLEASDQFGFAARLQRLYEEVGLAFPERVERRYNEVAAFHESVVRNRRMFLDRELREIQSRLVDVRAEREALDRRRSEVMQLLEQGMALDTFLDLQRELAEREAAVADLERRQEAAAEVVSLNDALRVQTAELASSVRAEIAEREEHLAASIALFGELGSEIYTDRDAALLVDASAKGIVKVTPRVSGDASTGVRSVETFMFDMVCVISAIRLGRAPRILIHDSHLFDAIDGRQVASCLNIGARLAETYGFQYVVTLNSDFLASVEAQSDGAFDSEPYVLRTRLTDESESGGLFGFRFE